MNIFLILQKKIFEAVEIHVNHARSLDSNHRFKDPATWIWSPHLLSFLLMYTVVVKVGRTKATCSLAAVCLL
jgi:hypothetical protein